MFNSEFSVESVRAARHSTPRVRRYVDEFLREVEDITGRSFPGIVDGYRSAQQWNLDHPPLTPAAASGPAASPVVRDRDHGAAGEASVAVNVDSLLSDIVEHVDIVIGDTSQDERVAQLLSLGPSVVPNINAAINRVVGTQGGHSTHQYENAGRLCEVIGELGGPSAFTILSRYADQDSNIWEYSHIREGARKGLGLLPQATPATPATPATKDEHSPKGGQRTKGAMMTKITLHGFAIATDLKCERCRKRILSRRLFLGELNRHGLALDQRTNAITLSGTFGGHSEIERRQGLASDMEEHAALKCTQCGKVYCLMCLFRDAPSHATSGGKACFACGGSITNV